MTDDAGHGDYPPPNDLRATRAEIDLDVLAHNIEVISRRLMPGTALMAVVKANAYGHGARMVAATALTAGASWLGVATVSEGQQLREAGIRAPILVLSPVAAAELPAAIRSALDMTIATPELLRDVTAASRLVPHTVGIHIKVDTGMHRYGCGPELAIALAQQVAETSTLRLAGVMTHFAAADEPDERATHQQTVRFDRCLEALAAHGIDPGLRHAANSAAALRGTSYHYDLARIGIAMYGLRPSPAIELPAGVRPVMTVRSRVGRVHTLPPGAGVGYGFTYSAEASEQAVLVPIGYADGYRRGLSNRGWMLVAGQRATVAGRVSMDQTVVRLPAEAEVSVGDDVVVFGGTDNGAASVDQVAEILDTISYEVVTGISARVPRHYIRDGGVVAVESLVGGPALMNDRLPI